MSKIGDVVFCVDCDLARSTQLKVANGDSSRGPNEQPRRMATKKDASGDALCTACLDARVQRRRAEFMQPSARSSAEAQPAASASPPITGAPRGAASMKPLDTSVRRLSSVRIERVRPNEKSTARKPLHKKGINTETLSDERRGVHVRSRTISPNKSTKSQTAAARPSKQTKTAFVLSQSADLLAREVVTAGKAAGTEMRPAYVHSVRYSAKRRKMAKRQAGGAKGRASQKDGAAATVSGLKKAETQVLEWILEHGALAVQRMVDGVIERIRRPM